MGKLLWKNYCAAKPRNIRAIEKGKMEGNKFSAIFSSSHDSHFLSWRCHMGKFFSSSEKHKLHLQRVLHTPDGFFSCSLPTLDQVPTDFGPGPYRVLCLFEAAGEAGPPPKRGFPPRPARVGPPRPVRLLRILQLFHPRDLSDKVLHEPPQVSGDQLRRDAHPTPGVRPCLLVLLPIVRSAHSQERSLCFRTPPLDSAHSQERHRVFPLDGLCVFPPQPVLVPGARAAPVAATPIVFLPSANKRQTVDKFIVRTTPWRLCNDLCPPPTTSCSPSTLHSSPFNKHSPPTSTKRKSPRSRRRPTQGSVGRHSDPASTSIQRTSSQRKTANSTSADAVLEDNDTSSAEYGDPPLSSNATPTSISLDANWTNSSANRKARAAGAPSGAGADGADDEEEGGPLVHSIRKVKNRPAVSPRKGLGFVEVLNKHALAVEYPRVSIGQRAKFGEISMRGRTLGEIWERDPESPAGFRILYDFKLLSVVEQKLRRRSNRTKFCMHSSKMK